ncbi:hypothetical protein GCM10025778_06300 [Paeniglutamicibacter antarcticus]|uniref:Pyridoxamine 5'-phosphate oxidase putative domain-containing protein n=2 Tax=Paeniglutamicibacter antarcticus TaxID=494023 RepID=A0ABP9TH72_9MICC
MLRGSDPWDPGHGESLVRSRAHTSSIPGGSYGSVISQRTSLALQTSRKNLHMEQETGTRRRTITRRWGAVLALAAAGAVIAGVAVLGQGGNFPQPAAPDAGPTPNNSYFNPDDSAQLDNFVNGGGTRLTGWLRAATPQDPQELQDTGWLLNIAVMSGGSDESHSLMDPPESWVPIDLAGHDASKLGNIAQNGHLVVIAAENPTAELITPVQGPYGVMVSDPQELASGPLVGARSLKTLNGTYLQKPDLNYNGAMLAQFATFEMAYSYKEVPSRAPASFKATGFRSHTTAEARSCVVATTGSGDKVLSFPAGATASTTMIEPNDPDDTVARNPLRIMTGNAWSGDGKDSRFILDTADTPSATIKGWPTGKNGTCGSSSGEIVKFSSAR